MQRKLISFVFVQIYTERMNVCKQVLENATEKLKNAQTFQEYVEVRPSNIYTRLEYRAISSKCVLVLPICWEAYPFNFCHYVAAVVERVLDQQ